MEHQGGVSYQFSDFIVVFNMLFYILNSTLQFLRCLGDSKVNLHKA